MVVPSLSHSRDRALESLSLCSLHGFLCKTFLAVAEFGSTFCFQSLTFSVLSDWIRLWVSPPHATEYVHVPIYSRWLGLISLVFSFSFLLTYIYMGTFPLLHSHTPASSSSSSFFRLSTRTQALYSFTLPMWKSQCNMPSSLTQFLIFYSVQLTRGGLTKGKVASVCLNGETHLQVILPQ